MFWEVECRRKVYDGYVLLKITVWASNCDSSRLTIDRRQRRGCSWTLLYKNNCPYAIDFSKAFDTVRHSKLLGKYSKIELPDCVDCQLARWLISSLHSLLMIRWYAIRVRALRQLHWLPVVRGMDFKVCTTMHSIHTSQCPTYSSDIAVNQMRSRHRSIH